jgi:hypothetical protein
MNGHHEFHLTNCVEDAIINGKAVTIVKRMECHLCGQRMNEAAPVCPGRKPDAPEG